MARPRDRSPRRELYRPAQPRRARIGLWLGAMAMALFIVAGRLPLVVETVYSEGIYRYIVWPLAAFSSLFDSSLSEIIFGLVGLALLIAPFAGWRHVRRRGFSRLRASVGALVRLTSTAGYAWFVFLIVWGINYQRPHPVALFHLGPMPSPEKVAVLSEKIGRRADLLRQGLSEDERGVVCLSQPLNALDEQLTTLQLRALRRAGLKGMAAGRAKAFRSSPLLLRIGVSGTYGLFCGEPNVVLPAAPGLLPFTLAHERAHLSGLAWEEAASYAGLLTLWESQDPVLRYSGWLKLWLTLRPTTQGRAAGVQRDLRAIRAFYREHVGAAAPAVQAAYGGFLRAHGVQGGLRSYGRFADLVLRRIARDGFPPLPPGVDSAEPTSVPPSDAAETLPGTTSLRPDEPGASPSESTAGAAPHALVTPAQPALSEPSGGIQQENR